MPLLNRVAAKVADMLHDIYYKHFGQEEDGMYAITWRDIRELVGGTPLHAKLIRKIRRKLAEHSLYLIDLDNVLVIAQEDDICPRSVPGRVINEYLLDYEDDDF